VHAAIWYTEYRKRIPLRKTSRGTFEKEDNMLSEALFVITLFVTRVALPIVLTLFLGYRLERKLNHDSH
jgi:hypothetical protein